MDTLCLHRNKHILLEVRNGEYICYVYWFESTSKFLLPIRNERYRGINDCVFTVTTVTNSSQCRYETTCVLQLYVVYEYWQNIHSASLLLSAHILTYTKFHPKDQSPS